MSQPLDPILKYFPELNEKQRRQLTALSPLYHEWNAKINVISRKDMDQFYERHVLHSLAIAKVHALNKYSRIMDVGTGGGFPGIPLAILYPTSQFILVDSIRKKTIVAGDVAKTLGLENVEVIWARSEDVTGTFDAVVTRAVAPASQLIEWVASKTKRMFALKGGDLSEELAAILRGKHRTHAIKDFYKEPFFETKIVLEWTK
jgi:16S rRNA (guanine527-N7)-methyltransferase